ncbi:MAG: hypothetical protein PHZ09_05090 [Eubacteriales bacterium]|nr:hypothetical protein [Eubacteriales bacterium]
MTQSTQIIVKNIIIPLSAPLQEAEEEAARRLRGILSKKDIIKTSLYKRSVDARHRDRINIVCSVMAETALPASSLDREKLAAAGAEISEMQPVIPVFGEEELSRRPVVAGFGPCGMFCAMLLAEYGYRPIVLERGGDTEKRLAAVERFYRTGILDTETNIQFGAGGAGAFSDGKLLTRINDSRCRYVLERLHELGAPDEIMTASKPHIGTDRLFPVVKNAAEHIEKRGGEIRYDTVMRGIRYKNNRACAVLTDGGEIECGVLVLAVGHSARDTYDMLWRDGFDIIAKPFSVGVRIEHLQSAIDEAAYGSAAGNPVLGPAEYALSKRINGRGVYTFCMCPGGEVVAAASEQGGVVTNGMSRHKRDGRNANAAIAVSVACEKPVEFQRALERAAYAAGGGNFRAPVQTVGDFLGGGRGTEPTAVRPSYMGGDRYTLADLNAVLPKDICDMLRAGIADFGRRLKGFSDPRAVLTGVETRTSAPFRILRSESFNSGVYNNIYPAGEGAGYAGGITSAAADGIACALAIMKRYGAKKYR